MLTIDIIYLYLILTCLSLLSFALSLVIKKTDLADFSWVVFIFIISLFGFFKYNYSFNIKDFIILGVTSIWSFRIGYLLITRILNQSEDSRYAYLRKTYSKNSFYIFLLIFLIQPIFAISLAFPFLLIYKSDFNVSIFDFLGILIWLIGFIGVLVSDMQLKQFKNNRNRTTKVCKIGLWNYSRHPNYFFESVLWFSYPLFLVGTNYFLISLISPILMLILLLYVTGVPHLEKRALETKGQEYLDYIKTTSKFFPFLKLK